LFVTSSPWLHLLYQQAQHWKLGVVAESNKTWEIGEQTEGFALGESVTSTLVVEVDQRGVIHDRKVGNRNKGKAARSVRAAGFF
jgi:hypothetical protein